MQRAITIIIFLALLAFGAYAVANGVGLPKMTYQVPEDPTMAAVMVASLVGVVVLTFVAGGGLAFLFGFLGGNLQKEKPGAPGSAAYGGTPVAPYVPNYSKLTSEQVDTRNVLIGSAIVLAILAAWSLAGSGAKHFMETLSGMEQLAQLIALGSVVGVAGAVVVVGAGLAFWFYRTTEEHTKAAGAGPAWPVAEMQALEEKLKSPEKLLPQMTLLDKTLIGLNAFLALVLVGVIAAWIVPAMFQVAAVDQSMKPTVAPKPTVAVVPLAVGPSADLKKELAALPKGSADSGKQLFTTVAPACLTCHMVAGDTVVVGPALTGVATRAEKRKPGYAADAYLYESITQPSAYLVAGFNDGLMPATFKDTLTPQQTSDLIAYLLTLK